MYINICMYIYVYKRLYKLFKKKFIVFILGTWILQHQFRSLSIVIILVQRDASNLLILLFQKLFSRKSIFRRVQSFGRVLFYLSVCLFFFFNVMLFFLSYLYILFRKIWTWGRLFSCSHYCKYGLTLAK